MLSTLSLQLPETPPLSGESPNAPGIPGPATGEFTSFADLLRASPATGLPLPTGENLPRGGKPLPPELAASLPPADPGEPAFAGDLPVEPAETGLAVPVIPLPADGMPVPAVARLAGPGDGQRLLPPPRPANAAGSVLPGDHLLAPGADAIPGEDGLSLQVPGPTALIATAANQAAKGAANQQSPRPGQAGGDGLAAAGILPAPVAGAGVFSSTSERPQPGPVLEAVLASLGRDATVLPAPDSTGLQAAANQGSTSPAFASALHALSSGAAGAGLANSSLPTPLPSTSVDVPVGEAQWTEAFGDRVLLMASGKHIQRAEIRLHPAELGPVQVRISMEDDATTLSFSAHHAVTRDAIEQALPRLRELFSDSGLTLGNATVTEHGGGQAERDQAGVTRGAAAADRQNAIESDDAQPSSRAANQLIDTFA